MPALRLHALDVPLAEPFRIAYDTVTQVSNTLASTRDGDHVGYGEAAPVKTITGEDRASVLSSFLQWKAKGAHVQGDVRQPAALAIPSPALRAGIEGALLDVAARREGVPLCTYVSGRFPAPIASSITLGLGADDAIDGWVDRQRMSGFRILKVKGGLGVEHDLARIRRVRERAGATIELRVDPNQAWTRAEAERALPELRDLGVQTLEQPLGKADLAGHAALRKAARSHQVDIMLDESVFSEQDAKVAIAAGACDAINIKLQKCGGIGPGLAIADLAQTAGWPCMVGCMVETRVGILQGAHLVLSHPNIVAADLDGHTFLATDPVTGGGVLRDGHLDVGRAPGIGLTAVAAGAVLDETREVPA